MHQPGRVPRDHFRRLCRQRRAHQVPPGATPALDAGRRLSPRRRNRQHRDGRRADDLLGDAPEQHVLEAAPSVRPHDDQICTSIGDGRQDLSPDHASGEYRRGRGLNLADGLQLLIERPSRGSLQRRQQIRWRQCSPEVRVRVRGHLDRVKESDRCLEVSREIDRRLQGKIGRLVEVEGDQDVSEGHAPRRCSSRPASEYARRSASLSWSRQSRLASWLAPVRIPGSATRVVLPWRNKSVPERSCCEWHLLDVLPATSARSVRRWT